MTISYNWLKEFIHIDILPEKMAELLTSCGLEVESLEKYQTIKGGLKGVVVGEVITCEKHPDADRLKITSVNVGADQPLNIVCGAANVAAGQKVLVATVGSILHMTNGEILEIKKSKIRGAISEGMICAEDELGLGTSHDGIMVLPADKIAGTPAIQLFDNYEDWIFEIGLTPNRADAASHLGVARDLMAVVHSGMGLKTDLKMPVIDESVSIGKCPVHVELINPEKCIRYSGVVIEGVKVEASPAWLKNKLASIGVRSINNIVDITNLVLHELGQPIHAFDLSAIDGHTIKIQTLKEATPFVTLDEKERKLSGEDLMICNANEPMCMAGVFGGLKSGVTEKTTSLFIESACFNPVSVRKTSKYHGIKTDSSFRFERGVDPNITVFALRRVISLVLAYCGGIVKGDIIDIYPEEIKNSEVEISYNYITSVIGKKIDKSLIKQILNDLQFSILSETNDQWILSVPTFKVDVTRPIDMVEEILRIYGYNNVEIPQKINTSLVNSVKPDRHAIQNVISEMLVSNGFSEIMSNSLTSSAYTKNDSAVKILNPLSSELDILRDTLMFGGIQTITYNINRKSESLKLFEFGKSYLKSGNSYLEQDYLSLWMTGNFKNESWDIESEEINYFHLKSIVETVLTRCTTIPFKLKALDHEYYEYGLCYEINNKIIVKIAQISSAILKQMECTQKVFYAEIDWDALIHLTSINTIRYSELPKFPGVRRDLSLLVDKEVPFGDLVNEALKTDKHLLKNINLFDVYEGNKLPESKKSYAISYMLQDENATLTDKIIDGVMNKIIQAYQKKFNAVLRG